MYEGWVIKQVNTYYRIQFLHSSYIHEPVLHYQIFLQPPKLVNNMS
jgi:hypothetical protein